MSEKIQDNLKHSRKSERIGKTEGVLENPTKFKRMRDSGRIEGKSEKIRNNRENTKTYRIGSERTQQNPEESGRIRNTLRKSDQIRKTKRTKDDKNERD